VSLLAAWLLFPLILLVLTIGCGLLLEALLRVRLPTVLLPGTGLAMLIVVPQFLALGDTTAKFSTPVAVAMAIAGFGLVWQRRTPRIAPWPTVAVAAVFAIYAAPIVLSGEATFAGYIKLDDTATWLAFTDWVMGHGIHVSGLAPSTYQALLTINLGSGYPVGAFLPLGIGHELSGQDVAWVIQPYMAFLGAVLALSFWSLASPLIESQRIRALAVFIASQPALLFGYYLWGGVKEMAVTALVAVGAAMVAFGVRELAARRDLAPRPAVVSVSDRFLDGSTAVVVVLSFVCAAVVGVVGAGGAVWLAPAAATGLVLVAWRLGLIAALVRAVVFVSLTVLLCIPVLTHRGVGFASQVAETPAADLGNLFAPLKTWQLAGIWPVGDFRLEPTDQTTTYVLIGVAVLAAIAGLVLALRARAWGPPAYVACALLGWAVTSSFGSPWVTAKALAIASPAIPFAAVILGGFLWSRGRRVEGGVLLAALAVGILWSNALAYRDVNLAPRDQLAELETIGEQVAGQGPTLMTEYQPYGVRHFLRDSDPEGLSELRVRQIPLITGGLAAPHSYSDTDQIDRNALLTYRTIVLRRNPSQSRPPAPYRLIWRGTYYEAWQRPEVGGPEVLDHLGLGDTVNPVGTPKCEDVMRLARVAGADGTLAAVSRKPEIAISLPDTEHPAFWDSPDLAPALSPGSPGTIRTTVDIKRPNFYSVWLGGSIRPEVDLSVDGVEVNSVREQINNTGQYVLLGNTFLSPGSHELAIEFHGADLHPGSGGSPPFPIGPLIISDSDPADAELVYIPADDARKLCGKELDWIEAIAPGTAPIG
jgi:hypothetical protein